MVVSLGLSGETAIAEDITTMTMVSVCFGSDLVAVIQMIIYQAIHISMALT